MSASPRVARPAANGEAPAIEPAPPGRDPYLKLPRELWTEILLTAVENDFDFIFTAARVSRKWRVACLANPLAWSFMRLRPHAPYVGRNHVQGYGEFRSGKTREGDIQLLVKQSLCIAKMNLMLERSGGIVRGLDIDARHDSGLHLLEHMATKLAPVVQDVGALHLVNVSDAAAVDAWSGKFARAHTFSIEHCFERDTQNRFRSSFGGWLVNPSSKMLRNLHVERCTIEDCDFEASQLEHVRHLRLLAVCTEYWSPPGGDPSPDASAVHTLLAGAAGLRTCALDIAWKRDQPSTYAPPIKLPPLTSWAEKSSSGVWLLSHVAVPQLRELLLESPAVKRLLPLIEHGGLAPDAISKLTLNLPNILPTDVQT